MEICVWFRSTSNMLTTVKQNQRSR